MTDEKDTNEVEIAASETVPPPDGAYPSDPPPRNVYLEVRQDGQKKKIKLMFEEDQIIVGRGDEENPVGVDVTQFGAFQSGVSRYHAAFSTTADGIYVQDMGSTNGTRINGFNIETNKAYRLRNGDEIEFGQLRTVIRFVR